MDSFTFHSIPSHLRTSHEDVVEAVVLKEASSREATVIATRLHEEILSTSSRKPSFTGPERKTRQSTHTRDLHGRSISRGLLKSDEPNPVTNYVKCVQALASLRVDFRHQQRENGDLKTENRSLRDRADRATVLERELETMNTRLNDVTIMMNSFREQAQAAREQAQAAIQENRALKEQNHSLAARLQKIQDEINAIQALRLVALASSITPLSIPLQPFPSAPFPSASFSSVPFPSAPFSYL